MANVKISGLPSATTPLAGTEVLPIVQGGVTDQVTVADLTAGRAMTALKVTATAYNETKVAVAASAIDLAAGNYFTKTISGSTTFTISNTASSGTVNSFILELTNGGSATVTWWSGVVWAAATPPTLTASGNDVLAFFTFDGGTTWNGFVLGLGMA